MSMGMAFFSTEGLIGSVSAKSLVVVDLIYANSRTGSKTVPLFSNEGGFIIPLAPMRVSSHPLLPIVSFDDATKTLKWAPPPNHTVHAFTAHFIILLVSRPDA